jgi:hypothetical protein
MNGKVTFGERLVGILRFDKLGLFSELEDREKILDFLKDRILGLKKGGLFLNPLKS